MWIFGEADYPSSKILPKQRIHLLGATNPDFQKSEALVPTFSLPSVLFLMLLDPESPSYCLDYHLVQNLQR